MSALVGGKTQCLYLPDVQRSLSLKTNLMSGKRNVFKNSGNFGMQDELNLTMGLSSDVIDLLI